MESIKIKIRRLITFTQADGNKSTGIKRINELVLEAAKTHDANTYLSYAMMELVDVQHTKELEGLFLNDAYIKYVFCESCTFENVSYGNDYGNTVPGYPNRKYNFRYSILVYSYLYVCLQILAKNTFVCYPDTGNDNQRDLQYIQLPDSGTDIAVIQLPAP